MDPENIKHGWDFLTATAGALVGTAVGAGMAFWLERRKRHQERQDEIITAANMALFNLGRIYTYLWNYHNHIITPNESNPARWFEIPRTTLAAPEFGVVDFRSLAFLFESAEPNLPNRIAVEFVRFDGLREVIQTASRFSDEARLRIAAATPTPTSFAEIEAACGATLKVSLEGVTSEIIDQNRQFLHAVRETASRLHTVVDAMYPDRMIYKFPPGAGESRVGLHA